MALTALIFPEQGAATDYGCMLLLLEFTRRVFLFEVCFFITVLHFNTLYDAYMFHRWVYRVTFKITFSVVGRYQII